MLSHLLEEHLRRGDVGFGERLHELQVDIQRRKVLLDSVVEVPLDCATLGVRGRT